MTECNRINLFNRAARLSLVALIFFSLQGEVIMRYAQIFRSKNASHHLILTKKTAEQQQLVKLQCFTKKLHPVALPLQQYFVFNRPLLNLPLSKHYSFDTPVVCANAHSIFFLRGPPAFI